MMVYADDKAGRSVRGDDDLEVHPTADRWEVLRIRGPQHEQTVLHTFDTETEARTYQRQLMVRSR